MSPLRSPRFGPGLAALLGAAALGVAAGCGGGGEESRPIPARSARDIVARLDEVDRRVDAKACNDVRDDSLPALEREIDGLPDGVDENVRTTLEDGLGRLQELVEADCEEPTKPKRRPRPDPEPEPTPEYETPTVPEPEPEPEPTVPETPDIPDLPQIPDDGGDGGGNDGGDGGGDDGGGDGGGGDGDGDGGGGGEGGDTGALPGRGGSGPRQGRVAGAMRQPGRVTVASAGSARG